MQLGHSYSYLFSYLFDVNITRLVSLSSALLYSRCCACFQLTSSYRIPLSYQHTPLNYQHTPLNYSFFPLLPVTVTANSSLAQSSSFQSQPVPSPLCSSSDLVSITWTRTLPISTQCWMLSRTSYLCFFSLSYFPSPMASMAVNVLYSFAYSLL